jgi:hypothetical protein
MRKFHGTGRRRTRYSLKQAVRLERLEMRICLSGSPLTASFSLESSPPYHSTDIGTTGTQDALGTAGAIAAWDPYFDGGDLLIAYQGRGTDSTYQYSGNDTPIVVEAFKPNGTGGLVLDTSFGGFDNDTFTDIGYNALSQPGQPGISIINPQLVPPDSSAIYGDSPNYPYGNIPESMAVDSNGNIDILFGSPIGTPQSANLLQLEPNGSAPNSSFGNSVSPDYYNGDGVQLGLSIGSNITIVAQAMVVDPHIIDSVDSNDILVAGESYSTGNVTPAVFAFLSSGGLDPNFGSSGPGYSLLPATNPDGSSATSLSSLAVDSNGFIYATDSAMNGIGVFKLYADGGKGESSPLVSSGFGDDGFSGWSRISNAEVSEFPAGGSYAPIGIGVTSSDNVIVGAAITSGTLSVGYILSTLSSNGSISATSDVGQQYIPQSSGLPSLLTVNPDGDVLANADVTATGYPPGGSGTTAYERGATWFSGLSLAEGLLNPYPTPEQPFPVFDNGTAVLADLTSLPGSTISGPTLAVYGNAPEAPQLLTADSTFIENGVSVPIPLDTSPVLSAGSGTGPGEVSVEGRKGSASSPETIQLNFASAISAAGTTATVEDATTGGADGSVGTLSVSGNDTLNIPILSLGSSPIVNNSIIQVTVTNLVNTATGISGTYQIELGILYGDITGTSSVNGTDFAILAANFGKNDPTSLNPDGSNLMQFLADINCDGFVNGTDFSLLASDFGKSLGELYSQTVPG